jgi:hypothetical protein
MGGRTARRRRSPAEGRHWRGAHQRRGKRAGEGGVGGGGSVQLAARQQKSRGAAQERGGAVKWVAPEYRVRVEFHPRRSSIYV